MILVIDNYDSFTWNLVQAFTARGAETRVVRNDAVDPATILDADPAPVAVVISPGPKDPGDCGRSNDVVRAVAGRVPLLGVCLGAQCIATVFGGRIIRGDPVHGSTSSIHHDGSGVLRGLPDPFEAARYHSLVIEEASLPPDLVVTARTSEGTVMALRHTRLPHVEGVQFHPESFLTPTGERLISNFLEQI